MDCREAGYGTAGARTAGAHKVAGRAEMYKSPVRGRAGNSPIQVAVSIMGPAKRLGCYAVADECVCF